MLHFLDLLGKNGTHGTQPEPSMGPAGVPVINKSEQWVTEPKKDGTHGTLKNYQSVEMPPCPGDEAERIAFLVQEGVPDSSDAERMALSEPCFDGWHAFAAAHADAVTAELDRLPVPSSWDGAALLRITRAFIPSPWNLLAVRHGWATHEDRKSVV